MEIRLYTDDDYVEVKEFVSLNHESQGRNLPERLGGLGVLIKEDNKIVAFCWALYSDFSDISCVEFFAVDKEKRSKKIYGPLVINTLLVELMKRGVKEVVGLLVSGEEYTESLSRIYVDVGMTLNQGLVAHGFIDNIIKKIAIRYNKG